MVVDVMYVSESLSVLENIDNSKEKIVTLEVVRIEDEVFCDSDIDEDCLIIDIEC